MTEKRISRSHWWVESDAADGAGFAAQNQGVGCGSAACIAYAAQEGAAGNTGGGKKDVFVADQGAGGQDVFKVQSKIKNPDAVLPQIADRIGHNFLRPGP